MVFYQANVTKMPKIYNSSTNRVSQSLRELRRLTFEGRKYDIATFMPNLDDVLKNKCPLLSQPTYVSTITMQLT